MKYKVILFNTASSGAVDESGAFSFYTYNSAYHCCIEWRNAEPQYFGAYLYDGETWATFLPVP